MIVPAGDPLWDDDVGRAALWLGRAWAGALAELGVARDRGPRGALACGPLGRLVCFATVGAGRGHDGRRAQGRRHQPAAHPGRRPVPVRGVPVWDPAPLVDLLGLDGDGASSLAGAAAGTGHAPAAMVDAFLAHLPA